MQSIHFDWDKISHLIAQSSEEERKRIVISLISWFTVLMRGTYEDLKQGKSGRLAMVANESVHVLITLLNGGEVADQRFMDDLRWIWDYANREGCEAPIHWVFTAAFRLE